MAENEKDPTLCQIEGCQNEWTHYLSTTAGVYEVCKRHSYELCIRRAELLKEVGYEDTDTFAFSREEIDHL